MGSSGKDLGEFQASGSLRPAEPVQLLRRRSNKPLIFCCILLAIIALGLGGYLVWDKFIAKHEVNTCATVAPVQASDTTKVSSGETLEKASFVVSNAVGSLLITNQGDAYFWQSQDLTKTLGKGYGMSFSDKFLPGTVVVDQQTIAKEFGDNAASAANKSVYKLDLTGERSAVANTETADGFVNYNFVMANNEGKVDLLMLRPSVKGNTKYSAACAMLYKKIDGYNNIVAVQQTETLEGSRTMLTDVNGNNALLDLTSYADFGAGVCHN